MWRWDPVQVKPMETGWVILSVLRFPCGKKGEMSDLRDTDDLVLKEAHYVLIDTENESGTKDETVTVQGPAHIWLQMIEAFSHEKWDTGGTGVHCVTA